MLHFLQRFQLIYNSSCYLEAFDTHFDGISMHFCTCLDENTVKATDGHDIFQAVIQTTVRKMHMHGGPNRTSVRSWFLVCFLS